MTSPTAGKTLDTLRHVCTQAAHSYFPAVELESQVATMDFCQVVHQVLLMNRANFRALFGTCRTLQSAGQRHLKSNQLLRDRLQATYNGAAGGVGLGPQVAPTMAHALRVLDLLAGQGPGAPWEARAKPAPLVVAAQNGNLSLCQALIAAGADANGATQIQTERPLMTVERPLMTALQYSCGDAWIVCLLNAKADPTLSAPYRKVGAGMTASGMVVPPLFMAAELSRPAALELMLTAKADINARSPLGQTALMHMAGIVNPTMVSWLLKKRADAQARSDSGETALHRLVTVAKVAVPGTRAAIARELVTAGTPLEALHISSQHTALMEAATHGHEEVVSLLCELKASVTARNDLRQTALFLAAKGGHDGVVETLVAGGANVDARSSSESTPLMEATRNGHTAVVRTLLAAMTNVNATSLLGTTALTIARQEGRADLVELLLASDAKEVVPDVAVGLAVHEQAQKADPDVAIILGGPQENLVRENLERKSDG